ncbi:TPA: hypothetical protein EYP45_02485 [Candidatus Peregrinibacteria bacterium]|nr:hypothetical protein [Candidatus Peregrinibacteria bacterium]
MKFLHFSAHTFDKSTEKKMFIGIAIGLLTLVGMVFLSFANSNIIKSIKADISATTASESDVKPVYIEKGYLLGGNTLYRNGESKIILALYSENTISLTQSIEVEMIEGEVTIQNYNDSFSRSRFILQEYINSSSISKTMEEHGSKNWAAVEILLKVPQYGNSQMPQGQYTLVASVHRDNDNKSQIFIPVMLKNSAQSCDINNDSFENIIDLILALKIMNGEITPSPSQKEKLDSNTNGILDLVDTLTIFKCILNPKQNADSYFENQCQNTTDPIDVLLCPTGQAPNIRHISIVETTDADGNTSTQTNTSYSPDPISAFFD